MGVGAKDTPPPYFLTVCVEGACPQPPFSYASNIPLPRIYPPPLGHFNLVRIMFKEKTTELLIGLVDENDEGTAFF